MTEFLSGLLAALGGTVLGLFYFAGLWFTLRRLPGHPHPALWIAGSFILRLTVSLSGLYVILGSDRSLTRLGIALLAFLAVRVVLTQRLQLAEKLRS
ncbi:MAG: ATP synthase subunit I [Gammaproteobacteria bacterium]|nr:ATP synthase subunit I [Gammaproteobacteria bacterium]HRX69576.1 ATP synthase subunit I [Candidatus Competibacteraceae bacterium]